MKKTQWLIYPMLRFIGMFIWWDGKINPCDVDYKSKLSVGNVMNKKIDYLWNS